MKLDKWPEEIECDGWRWKKHDEKHPCGVFYAMSKKTYTPPTMREIMEHLLKGGWVREVGCFETCLYRIENEQLEIANSVIREWGRAYCGIAVKYAQSWVYLVPAGQWGDK